MSRTNTQLTPLAARKQLLLVESEVNRAQLAGDWLALAAQLDGWKHKLDSLTSTASAVFAGVETIRGTFARGKSSLISTLFNAARSGLSLWGNLIARSR